MRGLIYTLILFPLIVLGQATPHQRGARFPSATQQDAVPRVVVMDAQGTVNGYILKSSLEPNLGSPTSDGQFLTSTVGNIRTWVDMPAGASNGIVAEGTFTTDGVTNVNTIQHNLGYIPATTRIDVQYITNPSDGLSTFNPSVFNITATSFDVLSTMNAGFVYSWRILGTDAATPLSGTEVISSIDAEIGTGWKTSGNDFVTLNTEQTISATKTHSSIVNFDSRTGFGSEGIRLGINSGVSGQRWQISKDPTTNDFQFNFQQTPTANLSGSYVSRYTLNNDGTPTLGTDLVDLDYFNANSGGSANAIEAPTAFTAQNRLIRSTGAGRSAKESAAILDDAGNLSIGDLRLAPTDTEPSPVEGKFYADDSEGRPKYYNGFNFEAIAFSQDVEDISLDLNGVVKTTDFELSDADVQAGIVYINSNTEVVCTVPSTLTQFGVTKFVLRGTGPISFDMSAITTTGGSFQTQSIRGETATLRNYSPTEADLWDPSRLVAYTPIDNGEIPAAWDIPSLKGAYHSQALTGADGAAFTTIEDLSGTGNNATALNAVVNIATDNVPEWDLSNALAEIDFGLPADWERASLATEGLTVTIITGEIAHDYVAGGTLFAKNDKSLGTAQHAAFATSSTTTFNEWYGQGGGSTFTNLSAADQVITFVYSTSGANNRLTVYQNGVQVSQDDTASTTVRSGKWLVGLQYNSTGANEDPYNGSLRRFYVHNEALTPTQILNGYNQYIAQ